MIPTGRKVEEPKMAWSRDARDATSSALRSLFSLLGGGKKKNDDDDDDDLPGPNATAALFPLRTLGSGFGGIATA